jgi:hypothetical protein
MATLDDCQHYASQCALWAAKAANSSERDLYLDMARAWLRVALVDRDVTKQSLSDSETSLHA